MKSPDKRVLETLGIMGDGLVEVERIKAPQAEVAEARGLDRVAATSLATLLALPAAAVDFRAVSSATFERVEARLEVLAASPRFVRVQAADADAAIDVATPPGTTGAWDAPDEASTVYLDLTLADALAVRLPGGTVVVWLDEAGVGCALAPSRLAPATLVDVEAPLAEWAARCDDEWLAAEVSQVARHPTAWSTVVAAGWLARLSEPTPEGAHAMVDAVLAGRVDDRLAVPRVWARQLASSSLDTIEDLALAESDLLLAALDDISREQLRGELTPVDAWVGACRRRDDLEGVRLLLEECGRIVRLTRALAVVDRVGERAVLNVPRSALPADERLRRASLRHPDAWWGHLPPSAS